MFEGQLEDVPPADAAEVDLLRRLVGGATQQEELWEEKKHIGKILDRSEGQC